MGPAVFRDNIDEYRKWFARLYPQYTLRVHYKYANHAKEHLYHFEIDGAKKLTMPWAVPVMWFEDPMALTALKEEFLSRMQKRTFEVLQ